MTPEAILRALESGSMKPFAQELTAAERAAVAVHIAGRALSQQAAVTPAPDGRCVEGARDFVRPMEGPSWNGWGADIANTRFQSATAASLSAETVGRLRLKWAFGFESAFAANAQPSVAGGRVFVGGGDRKVYALDAKTGCIHWSFDTDAVPLEPDRDIHAIAVQLVVVDNEVPEVQADAEHDSGIRRLIAIGVEHRLLDLDGGAQGIDRTGEFDHCSIAGKLDQPAPAAPDRGLDPLGTMRLQAKMRPAFIRAHQARVAHDVYHHDRRQSPYDLLCAHGASRGRLHEARDFA